MGWTSMWVSLEPFTKWATEMAIVSGAAVNGAQKKKPKYK